MKKALKKGDKISRETFAKLLAVPASVRQSMTVDDAMAYRYLPGTVYVIEPTTFVLKNVVDVPDSAKPVDVDVAAEREKRGQPAHCH